jgi:hypothetical protein
MMRSGITKRIALRSPLIKECCTFAVSVFRRKQDGHSFQQQLPQQHCADCADFQTMPAER